MTIEDAKTDHETIEVETNELQDPKTKKSNRKLIIGAVIAIVLIVAGVGGGIAYATHLENERVAAETEAHNATIADAYGAYEQEFEDLKAAYSIAEESYSKELTFKAIAAFDALLERLQDDKDIFVLYDGTLYEKYDLLQNDIEEYIGKLKALVINDYTNTVNANYTEDYEGKTSADIATLKAALEGLLATVKSDHEICDIFESAQDYYDFVSDLEAKIAALTAKHDELAEAERIAAEEEEAARVAAEQAAASSGYSGGYNGGSGYSGGGSGSGGSGGSGGSSGGSSGGGYGPDGGYSQDTGPDTIDIRD